MVATSTTRKMSYTLAERKTVPEVGCRSPAISLSIVDLPMPFGPTTVHCFGDPDRQRYHQKEEEGNCQVI